MRQELEIGKEETIFWDFLERKRRFLKTLLELEGESSNGGLEATITIFMSF